MRKLYIILLYFCICLTANAGLEGVITPEDLPANGRRVALKYTGRGYGYTFEDGRNSKNEMARFNESGTMGEIVYGEDNEVYIMNPVFTYFPDTEKYPENSGNISYIKGVLEGDEIVVTLPQKIFAGKPQSNSEKPVIEFLNVAEIIDFDSYGFNNMYYFALNRYYHDNTTRFKIIDNNLIWLRGADYINMMVVCSTSVDDFNKHSWFDSDWTYFGFGSFEATEFTDTQNHSDSEDFEKYSLITGDSDTLPTEGREREIDVCFTDDSRIFIRNITDYADGDIVGDIVDGTVVIPRQYLGTCLDLTSYIYFTPVKFKKVDGRRIPELQDNIVFQLDTVRKRLYTDQSFYINTREEEARPVEFYERSYIRPLKEGFDTLVPENPEIILYFEANKINGITENFDLLKFNMPDYSSEDDALDADNLYYRIYVDGELYEFSPAEYNCISKTSTDIPYKYDDGVDFAVNGRMHSINLHVHNPKSIGVQSVYKDGNEEYLSDIICVEGF